MSTPMPPRIEHVRDLLLAELGKLLTVEEALARVVLPKLRQEVQDEELKQAVSEHLEETRAHADKLREAFGELGETPAGRDAPGLDALMTERDSEAPDVMPSLRDLYDATAAAATEHYEIAGYEAALALAKALDETKVRRLLEANLPEETAALKQLREHATRLAAARAERSAVG